MAKVNEYVKKTDLSEILDVDSFLLTKEAVTSDVPRGVYRVPLEIAKQIFGSAAGESYQLTEDDDLNDVRTPGFYKGHGGDGDETPPKNTPSDVLNDFWLSVDVVRQIIIAPEEGIFRVRNPDGSGWDEWTNIPWELGGSGGGNTVSDVPFDLSNANLDSKTEAASRDAIKKGLRAVLSTEDTKISNLANNIEEIRNRYAEVLKIEDNTDVDGLTDPGIYIATNPSGVTNLPTGFTSLYWRIYHYVSGEQILFPHDVFGTVYRRSDPALPWIKRTFNLSGLPSGGFSITSGTTLPESPTSPMFFGLTADQQVTNVGTYQSGIWLYFGTTWYACLLYTSDAADE